MSDAPDTLAGPQESSPGPDPSGYEARGYSSFHLPTDPRYTRSDRSILDRGSASWDDDFLGIGSTPWNDPASSRIMVPSAATGPNDSRYLIRCATEVVGLYEVKRLRGLRQAVGIGQRIAGGTSEAPTLYVVEMDQVSPFWHFSDGNISWHLRILRAPPGARPATRTTTPGTMVDYTGGTDTVRLVDPNPAFFAPGRGIPPGWPLGPLGTFRDLRFPWSSQGALDSIDVTISGPAVIALYASVRQTDPATRQKLTTAPTDLGALPPEERFLLAYPNAIYRHVSGSLIVETLQQHRLAGYDPRQGETPEV